MKKRIFSIFLAAIMTVLLLPLMAAAEVTTLTGEGTETNPYQIGTLEELEFLAANVNSSNSAWNSQYYVLTADIGSEENPVTTPIGNNNGSIVFFGHFDGAGHTVYLNISGSGAALFSRVGNGEIKNLTVRGTVTGSDYSAGICACAYNSTIENCISYARVTGIYPNGYGAQVGGICANGWQSTTIKDCVNYGAIKAENCSSSVMLGGICGEMTSSTIVNCINNGVVSFEGACPVRIGGICGANGMDGEASEVKNCANNAAVTGISEYFAMAGGVCGHNMGTIVNCYSSSAVSGQGPDSGNTYLGGLCGYNVEYETIITNSFYDATVSGCSDTGKGVGLSSTQMQAAEGETLTTGVEDNKPLVDLLNGYIAANEASTGDWLKWTMKNSTYPRFSKHVHDFSTFVGNGSTITATCSNEDEECTLPDYSVSLTLATDAASVTGVALTGTDDWTNVGLSLPEIQYAKYTEGVLGTYSTTAPDAAGDYSAKITVSEKDATLNFSVAAHTVTVLCGTADKTTALPGETVSVSAESIITVDQVEKGFVGWTADNGSFAAAASNATTFTMPSQDVEIIANYRDCYPFAVIDNGTVTSSPQIVDAIGLTAEATNAPEGKRFKEWSAEGITLTDEQKTSASLTGLTMPANKVVLTAVYESLYNVTVTNGTASPTAACEGDTVTVTANAAADGMVFDTWTGEGVTFENANASQTTFSMPGADVSVTATYKQIPVKVPTPDSRGFTYNGANQTFTLRDTDGKQWYTISCGSAESVDMTNLSVTAKNAGTYPITVHLNNDNAIWEDGTKDDKTFNFVIKPLRVPKPEADPRIFIYNGNNQTYYVVYNIGGDYYDLSGIYYNVENNVKADIGKTQVTATPAANYCWDDGTSTPLQFDFTILENRMNPRIYYLYNISKGELTDTIYLDYYVEDKDNGSNVGWKLKDYYQPYMYNVPDDASYTFYLCDNPEGRNAVKWDDVTLASLRQFTDYYVYADVTCPGYSDCRTPITDYSRFMTYVLSGGLYASKYVKVTSWGCEIETNFANVTNSSIGLGIPYPMPSLSYQEKTTLDVRNIRYMTEPQAMIRHVIDCLDNKGMKEVMFVDQNAGIFLYTPANVGNLRNLLPKSTSRLMARLGAAPADPTECTELTLQDIAEKNAARKLQGESFSALTPNIQTVAFNSALLTQFESVGEKLTLEQAAAKKCTVRIHCGFNPDDLTSTVEKVQEYKLMPGERISESMLPGEFDHLIFKGLYKEKVISEESGAAENAGEVIPGDVIADHVSGDDWDTYLEKWNIDTDIITQDIDLFCRWDVVNASPSEPAEPEITVEGIDEEAVEGMADLIYSLGADTTEVRLTVTMDGTETDAPIIEAELSAGQQARYLDITIVQTTGSGSVYVTEPDVTLAFTLDFDFTNVKLDSVKVLRVHNGIVDTLTTTCNPDGEYILVDATAGTITIFANKFSTYAIVYEPEGTEPDPGPDPEPDPYIPATYPVNGPTTTENGKLTISTGSASEGEKITLAVKPDEGYELDFITVTDKNGNEIALTDLGNGKFSFTMPASKVTVAVSFKASETSEPGEPASTVCPKDSRCPLSKFGDTDANAWYHDGVEYCLNNGLMKGVSDSEFNPNGTTSRAMIVTILYRLEGEPAFMSDNIFSDVASGSWYEKAVVWASGKGIVLGYDDGTFQPDKAITREELAAILYRYAQMKGEGFVGASMFLMPFEDLSEISDWASESVRWCYMHHIILGRTETTFVPKATATRAEAAAMMQRFCENLGK